LRIGITQRIISHNGFNYDSLEPSWYDLFDKHEIIPIPNNVNIKEELYSDIDLLILSGGNDTVTRRIVETRLISFMMTKNKPIIGVCHGAFLLSELFEGVVERDASIKWGVNHHVKYFDKSMLVNSYHNLKISSTPPKTKILCVDEENNVECWIHNQFKIGAIVWHPERMKESFIPKEILNFIIE
jgi:gamma-glutamyl-gamma-aminobutyrate hydrolase PuuD